MSSEDEAAALLRRAGQRVTPQRLMVMAALREAEGHATAAEIFGRVREAYPFVDISTVYRTLASLRDRRLVTETDMGGGELRYEWQSETPHHHLICQSCGAVMRLEHETMASLSETLHQRHGFHANLDHFAIFGRCQICQEAAQAAG